MAGDPSTLEEVQAQLLPPDEVDFELRGGGRRVAVASC